MDIAHENPRSRVQWGSEKIKARRQGGTKNHDVIMRAGRGASSPTPTRRTSRALRAVSTGGGSSATTPSCARRVGSNARTGSSATHGFERNNSKLHEKGCLRSQVLNRGSDELLREGV